MRLSNFISQRAGQSLIEVLVASGIGAILITSAVVIITPTLKGSTNAVRLQVSVALGQELAENVRVLAESDWQSVSVLATSSTQYYLNTSSSPFTVATGTQNMMVATTTFVRYFYVTDVHRKIGFIFPPSKFAINDPSTKQITVVYGVSGGATSSMPSYITRFQHKIFLQTDWSGGGGTNGPVTSTSPRFATSSGSIDVASTTGSIILDL